MPESPWSAPSSTTPRCRHSGAVFGGDVADSYGGHGGQFGKFAEPINAEGRAVGLLGGAGAERPGANVVDQVRDFVGLLTEAIAGIIQPHQTLLVDDRVDVALALRARGVRVDGVHIGQDDLPVADARALLGADAVIGLTNGPVPM